MREIKFRAKKVLSHHDYGIITTKEWVYGSLVDLDKDNNYIYIIPKHIGSSTLCPVDLIRMSVILVDKNTVCQFTGLKDKNDKDVYEGDIVCFKGSYYVVKYFSEYGRFALSDNIVQDSLPMVIGNPKNYEVIGNIYENEDLLK